MIQRIQTVYLALVIILSLSGLFTAMGVWTAAGDTIASFSNFTFDTLGAFEGYDRSGPWCLGILLILVIFLNGVSIMLFRKRMRQLRLTILSTILLVGYVATYALFAYYYHLGLVDFFETSKLASNLAPVFHLKFLAVFPAISIILNCLAIAGIRKDEALVRSLDRIR